MKLAYSDVPLLRILCFIVFLVMSIVFHHIIVTGFWKTDQNVTLGLFHFIGQTNGYTRILHITVSVSGLVDWSAFLEQLLPTL